jgi:hypothetical protein
MNQRRHGGMAVFDMGWNGGVRLGLVRRKNGVQIRPMPKNGDESAVTWWDGDV